MLKFRTYKDNDLNAVHRLLQNNMEFDTISESVLKEKLYLDPHWNPDSCYIAENDGNIIGFMQAVTRLIRGEKYAYIKLMAVDKAFRRKGIASELFKKVEEEAKKQSCVKIRIYDVPLNYFMPGIDPFYTPAICFAEKMGFNRFGDAINMEVDLNYSDWDVSGKIIELKKSGIIISRATVGYKESLLKLLDGEWELWKNEINMAFKASPVAIHIAVKNNEVLAFSAYDANNIGTGWFGPMGSHEKIRGHGIGGVLLYLCLADFKKQGLDKCIIPWVDPIAFYSNYTNARISRVFWRYEKELKTD
ncbi:MAG: GNAT family N-acetyltransferase [Bacteroidales bacterium]|nr:GNAT family N-acetyltransferase [Bacteroidales bacterium]MCF8391152.1 GNAT family N-acetyltransferase [Bacteroidales bacterium]